MKKILSFILSLVMCLSFAACGDGGQTQSETSGVNSPSSTDNSQRSETSAVSNSPSSTENPMRNETSADINASSSAENPTQDESRQSNGNGTPVTLTIGDTVVPAALNDSKAARDLISRLPYTVTLQKYSHDFCAVMSDPFSYEETDPHDGWSIGDIDFVTGSNYFALLFNDSDTSSSPHVNLGKMEGDLSFFDTMSGSVEVVIALANTSAPIPSNAETKALVVYYSWSGNTEHIAQRIAANVRADTYEIRTVKDYPEDGHETAVISQEERRTGALPELVDDLPDISDYDTIYIGGPVWNSYMPTPLENYLEKTDFTGKTVIPFSTSQGSGQRGFQNDFNERVQNPQAMGEYKDFTFPNNYSPDAFTNEEIDSFLEGWLPGIGG